MRRLLLFGSLLAVPHFVYRDGGLTQYIIHTLVKATALENECHFRTQVSAIATHFLRTVFSTVHYMILLRQIPSVLSVTEKMRKRKQKLVIAGSGFLCYNILDYGLR